MSERGSWIAWVGMPVIAVWVGAQVWDQRPILASEPPAGTAPVASAAPFALVELFTSEGCSSCPSAEALLNEVTAQSRRDGQRVFTLAFHVDYWDRLGWADRFASPAHTQRQRQYARALRVGSLYTPQMIVNGEAQLVGSRRDRARAAIGAALTRRPTTRVQATHTRDSAALDVTVELEGAANGDQCHLALVERGLSSAVAQGENAGRRLTHDNVVRCFTTRQVGASKLELRVALPAGVVVGKTTLVVWVQDPKSMQVRGATALDLAP